MKTNMAKSVRLSSDEERMLCELWEWHGIIEGDFSTKYRAFIRYAHEHGSKFHGELPKPLCEKPNCDQFTEIAKGKYECTQARLNKTVFTRKVHLATCTQCQILRAKLEAEQKQREQKIIEAKTQLTQIHQTKTEQPPPTQKPEPAVPAFVNPNQKPIFELEVVKGWTDVIKADGSKMCPFSGDLVYASKECKQCKQTQPAMFTQCLNIFWQAQKTKSNTQPPYRLQQQKPKNES
jgi:hypothetical protein